MLSSQNLPNQIADDREKRRITIEDLTKLIQNNQATLQTYQFRAEAYFQQYLIETDNDKKIEIAKETLQDINTVIALNPQHEEAYLWRFRAATLLWPHVNVENILVPSDEWGADLYTECAAYYGLSFDLSRAENLQKEMASYHEKMLSASDKAIALNPHSLKARYYRAICYLHEEEFQLAREHIGQMSLMESKNKWTLYAYNAYHIMSVINHHQPTAAIPYFNTAISDTTDPFELSILREGRSTVYLIQGHLDLALADVNAQINSASNALHRAQAYNMRAIIANKKDNNVEAAMVDLSHCFKLCNANTFMDDDYFFILTTDLFANKLQALLDYNRGHILDYLKEFAKQNFSTMTEGLKTKYQSIMPIIEALNRRDALLNDYSLDKIKEINQLTNSINAELKILGSTDAPLKPLQYTQPLLHIVGFFVTKNREKFKESELTLTADLLEKLNNQVFLQPVEETDNQSRPSISSL